MKFISKSANLLVVVEPGLPAQPLTGSPAKPAVYVRFQDGIAEVTDEKIIKKMLDHPGFNSDFVSADETGAALPRKAEVAHVITEMKHGTPTKRVEGASGALSPELERIINERAIQIAKKMVPELLRAAREKSDVTSGPETKTDEEKPFPPIDLEEKVAKEQAMMSEITPRRGRGRPRKNK